MTAKEFLDKQEPERKKWLTAIHKIITASHKKIEPKGGKLMGGDAIIYEIDGMFLYALTSAKAHMSLHNIIMYGHKPLHEKYSKLLTKAKFQKGCINFTSGEQMPLNVIEDFMKESAKAAPAVLEIYKQRHQKKK